MNTFDAYYEKGIESGLQEGLHEDAEKGKELIFRSLLNPKKFTAAEIANFARVPESFVKRVGLLV